MQRRIRVVVAASAPAGTPGAATVQRLRDAGMEVIDAGVHDGAEEIVGAAVREDADVVALLSPAAARPELVPGLVALLKARGGRDVVVLVDAGRDPVGTATPGAAA